MTVAYIHLRSSDQQEWATVEHPPVLCTHVGQKKAMVNGKVEPGHSPAYSEPAGAERRTEASVELASTVTRSDIQFIYGISKLDIAFQVLRTR